MPYRDQQASARPIYIEHRYQHEEPKVRRYESPEAAIAGVHRATGSDLELIRAGLFGIGPSGRTHLPTSERCFRFGGDTWAIVTEAVFRERALYANAVADAIAAGQEPPA